MIPCNPVEQHMATPSYGIDRFLNIRAASGPSFSPDGRVLTFLSNITGVAQLWSVPVDGGWPTQMTFTSEAVRGAAFNPRTYQVMFGMDTGGNERIQLFLLTPDGGGTNHGFGDGWTVQDLSQEPKAIHGFGGWSKDGQSFAFSANRTKPNRFDIYVQKLGQPAKLLAEGPGGYFAPIGWSPDDAKLLVYRAESNFNQDLHLVDVATGKLTHLTPHKGDVQYESAKWSADGRTVFCASTHGGRDLSALVRIDVASGKLSFIGEATHEVESVEVAAKGGWLAYLLNEDGGSDLNLVNLTGAKGPATPALPLGKISELEFSPEGDKLAFTLSGPRHNSDIWVWDLKANKVKQVTHSSRAGIPFSGFVEPELVRYKSFDGLSIPAWFYPPKKSGDRPPPVIVYPHGGPESQTRPEFSGIFQYFIQAGYGIFAPNVRGSSGYGTKFMNLDNTTKRMDSVKDMIHGVTWLRDQKKADPKRIAVYGGSYGGFMVLAGVTQYPDVFAAGIDAVGIANFVTFLENTGAYRRAHREAEYGNLREHKAFLEEISPINHVDKIKCPMLILHGANDPRVPVGEAEQIVAALKKRNVPVEYLRYEDEGHGLVKLKNRLDAYPKMVAFLDRYLK
jgi:dipeptidyl aminopeptidase/acylaminoacyl peptidase